MPRDKKYDHLYSTKQWRALRRAQLDKEPLCRYCKELGMITSANVVNHIVRHQGDWDLFCDPDNLESVCQPHHDNLIRKQELGGVLVGSDVNGRPRDPNHPWNLRPVK